MKKELIYYDVDSLDELPELPDLNHRYMDFMGGTKEIRAFLAPVSLSRNDFFEQYPEYYEKEVLAPIYQNNGITISPDMSYAIPGFYVLTIDDYLTHCYKIPDIYIMRASILIKETRKALKEALDIECCMIITDENRRISNPMHYCIIPKYEQFLEKGIRHQLIEMNLLDYYSNFKYSKNKPKIIETNKKMKEYFEKNKIKDKDNEIHNLISNMRSLTEI